MDMRAPLSWLDSAPDSPDTPAQAASWNHSVLRIASTRPTDFIDVTDRLQALVAATGIRGGMVNIQSLHTTIAVVVNEHEPLLLDDFEALLHQAAPATATYNHDDPSRRTVNLTPDERVNGHSHCQALLLGPSACLNVVDGRVMLGRWQRVFVVDLDGPRERRLSVMVLGVRDTTR